MIDLTVNDKPVSFGGDSDTPLLWVLRDTLRLTGSKYGCGIGVCGACSVHVDGSLVRSCTIPVAALAGKSITTIEGLSFDRSHPLQKAWIEEAVPQCGYCQSGMIMAASDLLAKKNRPTDDDINRAITNICRCGTYGRIRKAIRKAATSDQS